MHFFRLLPLHFTWHPVTATVDNIHNHDDERNGYQTKACVRQHKAG